MVKKGYIECEKCGKAMKKTAKRGHKCETLDPNRPKTCPNCLQEVSTNIFAMHAKECESRTFCQKHMSFFQFLNKLLIKYNDELTKRHRVARRDQVRDEYLDILLEHEDIEPEIRREMLKIAEENKRREEDLDALKEAKSEGIAFSKDISIDVIKDTMKGLTAKISARQIIYEYLGDNGMLTDRIRERIDNKLKFKDYPTNKELMCNPQLFNKVVQVRGLTGYKERAERYYYMLVRHFNDPSAFRCPFCEEYKSDIKKHVDRCFAFELGFEKDKSSAIEKYLNLFYKNRCTNKEYYIEYYGQFGLKYFLSTISDHIKDRFAFREKINAGKRQFAKDTALPFKGSDMVKQVNEWEAPQRDPNTIVLAPESDKEDEVEQKEEVKVEAQKDPTYNDLVITMKTFFKFKKKPLPPKREQSDDESI